MKAKDYYDKYRPRVYEVEGGLSHKLASGKEVTVPPTKEAMAQVSNDIIEDFLNESAEIAKRRKIFQPHALKGLIEEFNDKWNAFCRLFERDYGESPFAHNGFRELLFKMEPRYKTLYEKRTAPQLGAQTEGE